MPDLCRLVSMTQENPQRNKLAEAGEASNNSGAQGLGEPSGMAPALAFSASSPSGTVSITSSQSSSNESSSESAVNRELRRLNRSLHALSACNQALAQAGRDTGRRRKTPAHGLFGKDPTRDNDAQTA